MIAITFANTKKAAVSCF